MPLNKKIQLACLPNVKNFPPASMEAFVVGWGKVNENATHLARSLQNAPVTIYDNSVCSKKFTIESTQICAGDLTGHVDSCQGDSGNAIYNIGVVNLKRKFIASGIVSYGLGCARVGYPA